MNFYTEKLLENMGLLTEDRISDLKNQNPDLHSAIDAYAAHDTTPQKKFLPWLVSQHKKGNVTPDDPSIPDTLSTFENHRHKLNNKDHNSYSYGSLKDAVAPHVGAVVGKKAKEDKILHEGLQRIHSGDGIDAFHVKTKEASQHVYGGGQELGGNHTSWCVAARSSDCMFEKAYGPMYTIHRHNDPLSPYAVHPQAGVITSKNNDGDLEYTKTKSTGKFDVGHRIGHHGEQIGLQIHDDMHEPMHKIMQHHSVATTQRMHDAFNEFNDAFNHPEHDEERMNQVKKTLVRAAENADTPERIHKLLDFVGGTKEHKEDLEKFKHEESTNDQVTTKGRKLYHRIDLRDRVHTSLARAATGHDSGTVGRMLDDPLNEYVEDDLIMNKVHHLDVNRVQKYLHDANHVYTQIGNIGVKEGYDKTNLVPYSRRNAVGRIARGSVDPAVHEHLLSVDYHPLLKNQINGDIMMNPAVGKHHFDRAFDNMLDQTHAGEGLAVSRSNYSLHSILTSPHVDDHHIDKVIDLMKNHDGSEEHDWKTSIAHAVTSSKIKKLNHAHIDKMFAMNLPDHAKNAAIGGLLSNYHLMSDEDGTVNLTNKTYPINDNHVSHMIDHINKFASTIENETSPKKSKDGMRHLEGIIDRLPQYQLKPHHIDKVISHAENASGVVHKVSMITLMDNALRNPKHLRPEHIDRIVNSTKLYPGATPATQKDNNMIHATYGAATRSYVITPEAAPETHERIIHHLTSDKSKITHAPSRYVATATYPKPEHIHRLIDHVMDFDGENPEGLPPRTQMQSNFADAMLSRSDLSGTKLDDSHIEKMMNHPNTPEHIRKRMGGVLDYRKTMSGIQSHLDDDIPY